MIKYPSFKTRHENNYPTQSKKTLRLEHLVVTWPPLYYKIKERPKHE